MTERTFEHGSLDELDFHIDIFERDIVGRLERGGDTRAPVSFDSFNLE